jgi:hypothetical protein
LALTARFDGREIALRGGRLLIPPFTWRYEGSEMQGANGFDSEERAQKKEKGKKRRKRKENACQRDYAIDASKSIPTDQKRGIVGVKRNALDGNRGVDLRRIRGFGDG